MATKKKPAKKPVKKAAPKKVVKPAAPQTPQEYRVPEGKVLCLRTCSSDLKSHKGFQWPESGPVECPDWSAVPECGNGLHGMLHGEGDYQLLNWDDTAKWLVVEVEQSVIIDLSGKVKFPRGVVVCCGDRRTATDFIIKHGLPGKKVLGGTATAGDRGTATAGYMGTAAAGTYGTATAGAYGCISILWYDITKNTYRRAVAEVDGVIIKANVKYRCDDKGKFVEVAEVAK